MEHIRQIFSQMQKRADALAVVTEDEEVSYGQFCDKIDSWKKHLKENGIRPGTICGLLGEFSPDTCALMFALMLEKCILVPFTNVNLVEQEELYEIAGMDVLIKFDRNGAWSIRKDFEFSKDPLIEKFLANDEPGLIVFTSGSSGKPKGILHSCNRVAKKFIVERPGWRTVMFLMMDHFGGFNTFLSSFAYGGVAVCLKDRSPESVCRAIEKGKATLLPTTPTFLNFMFASGAYKGCDLSSIKLVTYGTEVMPESTLAKTIEVFPNTTVKQTYGLSELGVLRSKSETNDSVWVKIGGEGFETKVKDGLLYIRSEANMIGYLNAPNPFDEEGWFCTEDQVEVRGEYMRILGRKSDLINVGGMKVFPSEVETVLLEADNISEAAVYGKRHPTMGNIVEAKISLDHAEDSGDLKERLRRHCKTRLSQYKIPVRFRVVEQSELKSGRFKKLRAETT